VYPVIGVSSLELPQVVPLKGELVHLALLIINVHQDYALVLVLVNKQINKHYHYMAVFKIMNVIGILVKQGLKNSKT